MIPNDHTDDDLPAEFRLIARYFKPLAGPGALDLGDDCAVVTPPAGRELVIAADAMVENVHFLPDQPPDLVARKLLRVNLSDLAAMGASPLGYLLTLAVPTTTPESWFASFAQGLGLDQQIFGISLLGGDTTSTAGPISLSLTILGHVPPGQAVRRSGARPGDGIWVSGTIGDGVLGLAAARGQVADPDGFLLGRYRLPTPRLALPIMGVAHAAMDVSDGLIQEIGHLARASHVSATVWADQVPLSAAARQLGPEWRDRCLAGGDDYELVMAIPPDQEARLQALAARAGVAVTRIGVFSEGPARAFVLDANGDPVALAKTGWSHF